MRLIDADKIPWTDLSDGKGLCYVAFAEKVNAMPTIKIETCEDTIGRKAMLEKIRTMQTYKLFSGDDMILVNKAEVQTELMMLPSVQPEQRWIPVTELPPRGKDLILKIYDKHNLFYYYHMGFHDGEKYYTYNFFWWEDKDLEIVGWQPCPWEEGEEE